MSDTIAAIATAPGPSAIGVVRLSGPDTCVVLDRVFRPKNGRPMSRQEPRRQQIGQAVDQQQCNAGESKILKQYICKGHLLEEGQHGVHSHTFARWIQQHAQTAPQGAQANEQRPENQPAASSCISGMCVCFHYIYVLTYRFSA